MKIEYKVVTVADYPILMSHWKTLLNKHGKDGWEYVMHEYASASNDMDILFKRVRK